MESIELLTIRATKTSIQDQIDNATLLSEIYGHGKSVNEKFIKDEFSTHYTYYEDTPYAFGEPESEKLISVLEQKVSEIVQREMEVVDIWSVVLHPGQSVGAHSHKLNTHHYPEEYISIAYYAQADEDCADFIFMVTACNTLERSVSVKVNTGDLLVFNSYLLHMTNRHLGTRDRVVISANLAPKNPTSTVAQDWSLHSVKDNRKS